MPPRLLIVVGEPSVSEAMRLFFYDLSTNDVQELASGLYTSGPFSPDGAQIAMAVVTEGENQAKASSVYLVDVGSLDATLFLEAAQLSAWVR